MATDFSQLGVAIEAAKVNVAERESKKTAESAAVVRLAETTQQANEAITRDMAAREAAHADTVAARRKVQADRVTLHALVDEVTADPDDADGDGEDDPKAAVNLK